MKKNGILGCIISLIQNQIGAVETEHLYASTDLKEAQTKDKSRYHNLWHLESLRRPKLRTFVQIHDFDKRKTSQPRKIPIEA